jgi:thiamine biosynthesis lipoprotein
MSFHDANSDVGRLNNQASARSVGVHAWTFQVMKTAVDLYRRSAGAFDIAVAPVLQNMGLLPHSAGERSCSGKMATTEAIELLPPRRVRFGHRGVKIDLGGIAKGFAVDRAVNVLQDHGMARGLVNAGGDLAVFGSGPHRVFIRDPRDPRRLICRIGMSNEALASSGRYLDPSESLEAVGSAVIDPSSRKPAHAMLGATVRAPCCMLADALTKVVMVRGASAAHLLEHYRAGALAFSADGNVWMTRDLQSAVCLAA